MRTSDLKKGLQEIMFDTEMRFELGKYYAHTTGDKLYICGLCDTKIYGRCLMGENRNGDFIPVGQDKDSAVNWHEISEEEFWDGRSDDE